MQLNIWFNWQTKRKSFSRFLVLFLTTIIFSFIVMNEIKSALNETKKGAAISSHKIKKTDNKMFVERGNRFVDLNLTNIYNQPCWCKWPCRGIIPGRFGSVCCPLISNFMLLLTFKFPLVKFSNGSMLVGATLSSVVEGVNGGSIDDSNARSWSWLCVCSCREGWMDCDFSGTLERVGTLDALCSVC